MSSINYTPFPLFYSSGGASEYERNELIDRLILLSNVKNWYDRVVEEHSPFLFMSANILAKNLQKILRILSVWVILSYIH